VARRAGGRGSVGGGGAGCAASSIGLVTTEVGQRFAFDGQLILWFAPYEGFPGAPGSYPNADYSSNYCVLAEDIGAASGVAFDDAGRILVASPRGRRAALLGAAAKPWARPRGRDPRAPSAAAAPSQEAP
jgi:hypothetical protein